MIDVKAIDRLLQLHRKPALTGQEVDEHAALRTGFRNLLDALEEQGKLISSQGIELMNQLEALEDANKRLEETEVKLRKGEEFGLGPYTLVPNEMFDRMTKALEAADELARACELDDVVYTFVQRYRAAREGKV